MKEIHRIADDGFDFVDLTLEPPATWLPDGKEVGRLIGDLGLTAVGHTAWHLPIASPFKEIRDQSRELYRRALDCFADAGVELVNVHPDQRVPMHGTEQIRKMNADAIADLVEDGAARKITIMVENLDRRFSDVDDLRAILDAVPDARFHLDVGHANLRLAAGEKNRTTRLLEAFGTRLAHVHLSDNRGGAEDLHLPLGAGVIDWSGVARQLTDIGYDGTVTLEVFSREREHLRTSRKLWLNWWSEAHGR